MPRNNTENAAYMLNWGRANPAQYRRHGFAAALKHKYGITVEEYARMYYGQNCACASCKSFLDLDRKKYVCIDHDHDTNQIRGLLCAPCNKALGVAEESVPRLLSMVSYLEAHRLQKAA